ncbi:MAG: hypothetical protein IT385_16795 [Deltaproteobacteria bacterium]|nr:hypothetical protein [Deltaproteobacteria bacterium]
MSATRLSITLDPALGAAVRAAARRAKLSVSAWIAEATADRLRHEALKEALVQWQSDDGAFTSTELAAAAKALIASPHAKTTRRHSTQ